MLARLLRMKLPRRVNFVHLTVMHFFKICYFNKWWYLVIEAAAQ